MSWEPRNLNVLNVDDKPPSTRGLDAYVSFRRIEALLDACKLMLGKRNRLADFPVDLLFCDVNMEEAKEGNTATILWSVKDKEDKLPAYGPLLALPFLSTCSWCQIVPISSYWTSGNVKFNGYVLVALAMILSMIDGTPRSMADAARQIPNWDLGESNPKKMLQKYLPQLRAALLKRRSEERVTIWGVDRTIECLKQWKQQAVRTQFREKLPLTLDKEPICLELIDEDTKEVHLIHISSLFSDVLGFAVPTDGVPIDSIIAELRDRWASHSFPLSVKTPYQAARRSLFPFLPDAGDDKSEEQRRRVHWKPQPGVDGPWLKLKLTEDYKLNAKSAEFFFAVRLAMLFAWVRAWYLVKKLHLPQGDMRQNVYHFLGCTRYSTPQTDYKRLLGSDDAFGTDQYTRPFRPPERCLKSNGRPDILKGYALDDEDGDIVLSEYEKVLCAHFVESGDIYCSDDKEKIYWKENERPKWMR